MLSKQEDEDAGSTERSFRHEPSGINLLEGAIPDGTFQFQNQLSQLNQANNDANDSLESSVIHQHNYHQRPPLPYPQMDTEPPMQIASFTNSMSSTNGMAGMSSAFGPPPPMSNDLYHPMMMLGGDTLGVPREHAINQEYYHSVNAHQRMTTRHTHASGGSADNEGNHNGSNYEFLIEREEDYEDFNNEQIRSAHYQNQMQALRWQSIGEKAGLVFALREALDALMVSSDKISDTCRFQDRALQISGIQTHFSQNSVNRARKPIGVGSLLKNIKLEKQGLASVVGTLQIQSEQFQKLYQRECQRSQVLEQQLHHTQSLQARLFKDRRLSQPGELEQFQNDISDRDQYIEELSSQLTEARSQLLECKIKLTDKDESITQLQRQLHSLEDSYGQLEEQKRELDDLVIKVSKEMRRRDYDIRDLNYQAFQDKEHLIKQVELLKKELSEERDKYSKLEHIEEDLIHKLQQRESEAASHKVAARNAEEKLSLQMNAVAKAQKVIQALEEESNNYIPIIKGLEKERNQLKADATEQKRLILDITKQLQIQMTQHQQKNHVLSMQKKSELGQLQEILKHQKNDFEVQRKTYEDEVQTLKEAKFSLEADLESIQNKLTRATTRLERELSDYQQQNKDLTERFGKLALELKEKEAEFQIQFKSQEQQNNARLNQLHLLLRQQLPTTLDQQTNQNPNHMCSYLATVRFELSKLLEEQVELRGVMKRSCYDNSSQLVIRLQTFSDFRDKVLDSIEAWERKAVEITELSQKYYNELEENKRLFVSLKALIKEKDQLISQLQWQTKSKDQALQLHTADMRREYEKQGLMIREGLIQSMREGASRIFALEDERREQDIRFASFKQEYAKTLETRDLYSEKSTNLIRQVDSMNYELLELRKEHIEFLQRLKLITSNFAYTHHPYQRVGSATTASEILGDVELLFDELRVRRDEAQSYKAQITLKQQELDKEKSFMREKIMSVEHQLETLRLQTLTKEEEQQVQALQKETKFINELQQLQKDVADLSSQLQTRERQIKKLQDKQEAHIALAKESAEEKQKLAQMLESSQQEQFKFKLEIEQLSSIKERAESELSKKNEQLQDLETETKKLQESWSQVHRNLMSKEIEVQRERELNLQLQDEKYHALSQLEETNDRNIKLDRECEALIQDIQILKARGAEAAQQIERLQRDKQTFSKKSDELGSILGQAQMNLRQFENTVEQMKIQLERAKAQKQKMKNLKLLLKDMRTQETRFIETIADLRRKLTPLRTGVEIQTEASGMMEIEHFRKQTETIHMQRQQLQNEYEELKKAYYRQGKDIDLIIENKKDLEDIIEQQNKSMKQFQYSSHNGQNSSIGGRSIQGGKENSNGANRTNDNHVDYMTRILQEKENYISRLEAELMDYRKEVDTLKEKLIHIEMGGFDRTLSTNNCTHPGIQANISSFASIGSPHQRSSSHNFNSRSGYKSNAFSHFGTITMPGNHTTILSEGTGTHTNVFSQGGQVLGAYGENTLASPPHYGSATSMARLRTQSIR